MITLDFIPVKRRPRFTRRGRAYTDAKTRGELARIAASWSGPKLEGPLSLYVGIYKPTPKGIRKAMPFVQKPDADNVLKAVMDGLKGVAYDDDNQIVLVAVMKHDREPGIRERTVYELRPFRR